MQLFLRVRFRCRCVSIGLMMRLKTFTWRLYSFTLLCHF